MNIYALFWDDASAKCGRGQSSTFLKAKTAMEKHLERIYLKAMQMSAPFEVGMDGPLFSANYFH